MTILLVLGLVTFGIVIGFIGGAFLTIIFALFGFSENPINKDKCHD